MNESALGLKGKSLALLYALNAVATALQTSIRSEEAVYAVFQQQTVTLGLRGGISLLDEQGEKLHFKTVAFVNPLKKILKRFETKLNLSAEGYSVPVDRVDVYQRVIREGRSVFVTDTSTVSAQAVPKQIKALVKPLLMILGHPPGIFTPLVYDGQIKGMLNIVGPDLTEADIHTMQAFANQIAVALENARLVRKLQGANEELQREIAELERFTYTISHELKTPLVTIKGFMGSIAQDLQDGNYARAQKDFPRVATAADRMLDTLSGLLELSRIGRVAGLPEEVPLGDLVPEVLETVRGRFPPDLVVSVSPDLPVVCGDRSRLREVYQNLIENALQNFGDQPAPRLEVGMRKAGRESILFVQDNGIGIDAKYHTRIFDLFEKLDARSEGAGIGLALVKRIVEAHHGRIWVESAGTGQGSTFCFTIPDGAIKP